MFRQMPIMIRGGQVRPATKRAETLLEVLDAHQAASQVIRGRYQATIRVRGEQGRPGVSSSFSTGSLARGLSCCLQQGANMIGCTRVRIIDDLTNHTTIVETAHNCSDVFELAKLVKLTNRRKEDALHVALHLTEGLITIHWHTPWYTGTASNIARAGRRR